MLSCLMPLMTMEEIELASTHREHEVSEACVLSPFINFDAGLRTKIRDARWPGGASDKLKMLCMLTMSTALQVQPIVY